MKTDFSNGFTTKQKVAILVILGCLSEIDHVRSDEEMNQLIQIASLLDVDLESPLIENLLNEVGRLPYKDCMGILSELNKTQKEWIIVCAVSIAAADGEIVQSEENAISNFCEHFGISNNEFGNIIKKMSALQGKVQN